MKQAIIIGTRPDRKEQLQNCLNSFTTDHDILIADCDGYEIGKIKWVLNNTDIDEFVFLQDTIEVKNPKFIDICFALPQSVSICNYPFLFGCYLGKYKRSVLEKIDLPDIKDKREAVEYEMQLGLDYCRFERPFELFDDLHNVDNFVEKFGHKVMKIENDYLIKYKSIWNRSML
jgi:hypothetical protein